MNLPSTTRLASDTHGVDALRSRAATDPKGGAVEHGACFFSSPTCHHAPEVYGGIEEARAAAVLRAFFAARR